MGNCQAAGEISVPSTFQGIVLNCRTWKKTYSNLYDYSAESEAYIQKCLTVGLKPGDSYCLAKHKQQLQVFQQTKSASKPENPIMRLANKDGHYLIQPCENLEKLASNQIWLAVKSTPSHKYKLKQGDILRIGNQKVKVKEIILQDNVTEANLTVKSTYKVYENMTKQNSKGYDPEPGGEQPTCRVCLQEGQINNPLLAPCKCSGSAKFIHIKCIQEWFNKLINPHKVNSSIVITWKPLICQLCSQSLPFKIYLDEAKHFTVNIPRPEKPYLVLNPVSPKQKSNSKVYHLISLKFKKSLTIGRKKQADIVLDDDSTISRYHSLIQIQEKPELKNCRVTISDKDSKFGTLVLIKKAINLSAISSSLILQFGGNIVTLNMRQNNNRFIEIGGEEINQSDKSTSTETVNEDDQPERRIQTEVAQNEEYVNTVTNRN